MDQGFLIYPRRCWHLGCFIFHPSLFRTTTSENDDQGVARGDERISQGMHHPKDGVGDDYLCSNILTILSQSENSNPIYGISSDNYVGKGHVQSKTAKAQGISLEAEE